jgi:glycosyltransferase involved in cell wall biosynthesis
MNQQLTIVIPCKNESEGIIEVINLILSQINCKIIIADSSDHEGSVLLLHKHTCIYSNIEIIKGGFPAVARNNGAKLVKTPYVLFLDADIYPESGTIKNCINLSNKHNYHLVTCRFKTDKKYNWIYRVFDLFQWYSSKTKPFALGGFMLFKTDVFKELKGFNEEDKIAEDYHLSSKIKTNRFKIANDFVYTSSRRFDKKGVWYMIKLAFNAWINRNNDDWFKKDHNYWK